MTAPALGVDSPPAAGGISMRSKLSLVRLPMMPQVLMALLDIYHRDDIGLSDVADIVRRDAAISAKILAVANSAEQHGRRRPASVDQCLSMLGMATLKKIVINESIVQVFRRFAKEREFDLRRFWEHSLRSALIARELARAIDYPNSDEAYLGGMLHDVGQLAMLAADADRYLPLIAHCSDEAELCQAEQQSYKLMHAEVGAWLIDKWKLDSLLSDAVLYHHDAVDRVVGAHPLIRIVYLANRLAQRRGLPPRAEDGELARLCDAGTVDLPPLLERVGRELFELAEEFGIELPEAQAPGAETGAAAEFIDHAGDALSDRVRDVLLIDNVLCDMRPGDGLASTLRHIAQAAQVLFRVNPVFYFLPQGENGDVYRAHPLGGRQAPVDQLEFVRGRGLSAVARAIDQGIVSITAGAPDNGLLDDQLLRLTGNAGLLLVPLRSQGACRGVLVAGFESALQANDLWARIPCFESFARIAGDLLRQGAVAQAKPIAASAASGDEAAVRERLRRVVHEIGNPLAIIQNYLSALKAKYAQNNVGVRELGIVSDEISRLTRILHGALDEASQGPSEPGPLRLNALIENLVALYRSSGFGHAALDIRTELYANPPELWSDGDRLKQLLLNLIKNAIEAMPGGGVITIATAPWGNGAAPTHVEIRVEDNGPGLPAEVLAHLYQPVASDKGGSHQGVGLAIVGQLVSDLHGLINCRSTGQGSCFQLLLPVSRQ